MKRLPLETRLAESWPPDSWADVPVLLAVSGGADSMALLRAIVAVKADHGGQAELRAELHAAHVNHGLRGRESDLDEQLVVEVCRSLDAACHVCRVETRDLAEAQGDGLEAAARHARYEVLSQTAERLGARYVATAHTADDQIETILHRIVRGTGMSGLSGIPRVRALSPAVTLIRPLLAIRRVEIEEYLRSLGQSYRDDESNTDRRFTRNHIRHELLPLLRERYNANVDQAILRLGAVAGEAQSLIDSLVDDLLERAAPELSQLECASPKASVSTIELLAAPLIAEPRYLVRETIRRAWESAGWPRQAMGFEQWDRLAALAADPADALAERRIVLPGAITATGDGERLVLSRDG